MVVYFNNQNSEYKLRFIVSTIPSPREIINNKSKASEKFEFMCCDDWKFDSSRLFDSLSKALDIEAESYKNDIILKSSGSPRTLKNIFRKIIVLGSKENEGIERAINLAIEETVN